MAENTKKNRKQTPSKIQFYLLGGVFSPVCNMYTPVYSMYTVLVSGICRGVCFLAFFDFRPFKGLKWPLNTNPSFFWDTLYKYIFKLLLTYSRINYGYIMELLMKQPWSRYGVSNAACQSAVNLLAMLIIWNIPSFCRTFHRSTHCPDEGTCEEDRECRGDVCWQK